MRTSEINRDDCRLGRGRRRTAHEKGYIRFRLTRWLIRKRSGDRRRRRSPAHRGGTVMDADVLAISRAARKLKRQRARRPPRARCHRRTNDRANPCVSSRNHPRRRRNAAARGHDGRRIDRRRNVRSCNDRQLACGQTAEDCQTGHTQNLVIGWEPNPLQDIGPRPPEPRKAPVNAGRNHRLVRSSPSR